MDLKYKVGDKVRVKSKEKMIENKVDINTINLMEKCHYFGRILTIKSVNELSKSYSVDKIYHNSGWEDNDFEGLVDKKKVELIMKDLLDKNE